MLCRADDFLATVATVTVSRFASGTTTRAVILVFIPLLFFDPSRETTDPLFELHALTASEGGKGSDVIFVLVIALVSVFRVALLPEQATDLAVNPPELVTDGTTMLELPEGLLQPPVSVDLLSVKPYTGFLQLREGVTEFAEINF